MDSRSRLALTVAAAAILGVGGLVVAISRPGPPLPAATLVLLAAVGTASLLVSVPITDRGSSTSVQYLPVLAAMVVAGPAGAGMVAAASHGSAAALDRRRPLQKAVYNVAQVTLAGVVAGAVFLATGGAVGAGASLADRILPFLAASLTYFLVNRAMVTTVVSLETGEGYAEVWRQLGGGMLPMDLALSLLALLVAQLHPAWGAPGQLLLLLPVVGARIGYAAEGRSRMASRDLLKLTVKSLEAQDPYTSGHSQRVAEAARRVARELGMDREGAELVETAALLHDIGKIGVEYAEILTHEGRLTEEQFALVREHPERGAEILGSLESLDERVLRYVLHHHERWDGEGYPEGLEGERIPLGARIVGLCDAVDAMGSERSYRSALSAEAIRRELRRCSGSQFDPSVVQAALALELPRELAGGERAGEGRETDPAAGEARPGPARRRAAGSAP